MNNTIDVIAVIPARGGSKGFPRKNLQLLGGVPLIARAIGAAKQSRLVKRIFITTDDREIRETALQHGAEAPFVRPAELALDDTPAAPVLKHTLDFLSEKEGLRPEIIVWLEPPCPFRTGWEVDAAVKILQQDPSADSLRSVCEPFQNPYKSWTLEESYLKPLMPGEAKHSGPRQKIKKVFWQNGAIFLVRYNTIMNKGNFFGDRILPYVMPRERFIDIDTKEDLALAEWYLPKFENEIQNS